MEQNWRESKHMCGRFTLHHTPDEIAARFAVQNVLFEPGDRYNIAPTQKVAVVTYNAHGDEKIALESYRWGLIPSWAKEPPKLATFNARIEGLASKPLYRGAFKNRRRCLIVSDGLYEWKKVVEEGKEVKQPYHIRFRDGRLFAFAGLWEQWEGPDGSLSTCTMVTGEPNYLVKDIHDRLAKIVNPQYEEDWLDPNLDSEMALQMLGPVPDEEMEAVPVNRKVGNTRYDAPDCIGPIDESDEE
jgi:putative SOS response-associated peptidase YedK